MNMLEISRQLGEDVAMVLARSTVFSQMVRGALRQRKVHLVCGSEAKLKAHYFRSTHQGVPLSEAPGHTRTDRRLEPLVTIYINTDREVTLEQRCHALIHELAHATRPSARFPDPRLVSEDFYVFDVVRDAAADEGRAIFTQLLVRKELIKAADIDIGPLPGVADSDVYEIEVEKVIGGARDGADSRAMQFRAHDSIGSRYLNGVVMPSGATYGNEIEAAARKMFRVQASVMTPAQILELNHGSDLTFGHHS
ncbi:hypothetical protein [Alcanivorax sp. 1008]|uniref:hypothetical protein n=1 Tax=Alcanivorax sp. 1008 TaxID=2816853 RepID=UPI001D6AB165|nr:hypothetical protein [Alcanivorax sp. 1008]MCC1496787.1 hypothetical protein [Alcanivorax sp. 1008]